MHSPPRRSMRGRYASYWNAFLFYISLQCQQVEINFVKLGGHVNAVGAFVDGAKLKRKPGGHKTDRIRQNEH